MSQEDPSENLQGPADPQHALTQKVNRMGSVWLWIDRVSHAFFWLCLSFWLLITALILVIHFVVLPRVDVWRPRLESALSKAMGATVSIDRLQASTNGLFPVFEVNDLKVLQNDQVVLSIPRLSASFSGASLARLSLERLTVEDLHITAQLDPQSRLWVGGMEIAQDANNSNVLDHFFSVRHVLFSHARIDWKDDLHGQELRSLMDSELTINNGLREHTIALSGLGSKPLFGAFDVRAKVTHPILSLHPGRWQEWSGEVFAQALDLDVPALMTAWGDPASFSTPQSGEGWVRVWSNLNLGELTNPVVDFSLQHLKTNAWLSVPALSVQSIQGRVSSAPWGLGRTWKAQHLWLQSQEHLPAHDLSGLTLSLSNPKNPFAPQSRGELQIPLFNIDTLNTLGEHFFPSHSITQAIEKFNAHGELQDLDLSWGESTQIKGMSSNLTTLPGWIDQYKHWWSKLPFVSSKSKANTAPPKIPQESSSNPLSQLGLYHIKGKLLNFERSWISKSSPQDSALPAIHGLNANFEFNQEQGHMELSMGSGFVEGLNFLDQSHIDVEELNANLSWLHKDSDWQIHVDSGHIKNQVLQGQFNFDWTRPDSERIESLSSNAKQDLALGHLDLDAHIVDVKAQAISGYLPSVINPAVRRYLNEALQQGHVSNGHIRIKGPLALMPFTNPKSGEFSVTGHLNDLTFNFYPPSIQSSKEASNDWPLLTGIDADLHINGARLEINNAKLSMGQENPVVWPKVEARIDDLMHATLEVSAQTKSALSDQIFVFNHSWLSGKIDHALEPLMAKGLTELKLKLTLPLTQIDRTRVLGSVQFLGNDLQFTPDTPSLSRIKGSLNFTESGFALQNMQAKILGGDAKIDGGLRASTSSTEAPLQLRVNGLFTAQGLIEACELGWLSNIGNLFEGSAPYNAQLNFRRTGDPEILLTSALQGVGINGPLPLSKTSASILNLKYQSTPTRESNSKVLRSLVQVSLGDHLSASFIKEHPSDSNVNHISRGFLYLNSQSVSNRTMPSLLANPRDGSSNNGWMAQLDLDEFNFDAWQQWLSHAAPSGSNANNCERAHFVPSAQNGDVLLSASSMKEWPVQVTLKTPKIFAQGRLFNNTSIFAKRDDTQWRVDLNAAEVKGHLDLKLDANPKLRQLSAKLNLLNITPRESADKDPLLSDETPLFTQLDLSIEDLQLKSKSLGHASVRAINEPLASGSARAWRFSNIELENSDVTLKAQGRWESQSQLHAFGNQSHLDLDMNIINAGQLLDRLGTPGVVKNGKGSLKGQLSWQGSLINPQFDTLNGAFNVDIERGQFLKTDPGAARLLGVLNLQALPRRLTLDFRDLFAEGFSFDNFKGDVEVTQGEAQTHNLIMKGVSAAVMLEGRANIGAETQDVNVVVVPEINAGTASLFYSTINPIVGLTSFLAQVVLREPLIKANTRTFHISGSWSDPQVNKTEISTENAP
jgi:uncharacterized protein (TIGR02099 family)